MNDDLTTRLSRQLHEQVDGWHDAPLTLEGVQGRARTIRRRRQALTTGLVAAAVLAVAVPVGVGLGARTDSTPDVTSPTRMVDAAPTPRPDGTFPLTVDGLAEGAATTAYHLVLPTDELRSRDGVRAVPEGTVQVERFDDGWLALQSGDFGSPYGTRLLRLDDDLQVVEELGFAGSLTVAADGQHAAWVQAEGGRRTLVQVVPEGDLARTDVGTDAQLVGHLTGDRVVLQDPDYETGRDSFGVVGADGRITPFDGIVRVVATSEASSQVSAMTEYGVEEVCYAVLDPTSGTRAFESCDLEPHTFSPDGSLVAAFTAGDDGMGSPQLAVLDAATGDVLVEWSTGRTDRSPATVQQVVWEDDDTLVATVTEGVTQTIVRGELDGTLERVAEPLDVPDLSIAYRFAGTMFGYE